MSNSPNVAASNRERILDTAERLFGQHGIDSVSLRQIGEDAGQKNKTAIQYHFGSKEGLAKAIIQRRSKMMEPRIDQMYAAAGTQGRLDDMRALIEILFLPVWEVTDSHGDHSYAAFLLQYMHHPEFKPESSGFGWDIHGHVLTWNRLKALVPGLGEDEAFARLYVLNGMFVSSMVRLDSERKSGKTLLPRETFLNMLLDMMVAAFAAGSSEGAAS